MTVLDHIKMLLIKDSQIEMWFVSIAVVGSIRTAVSSVVILNTQDSLVFADSIGTLQETGIVLVSAEIKD